MSVLLFLQELRRGDLSELWKRLSGVIPWLCYRTRQRVPEVGRVDQARVQRNEGCAVLGCSEETWTQGTEDCG